MNPIITIFEATLPNGVICQFGNQWQKAEPRIMANKFVYTYTMSNEMIRRELVLTENTIGAALDALDLYGDEHHLTWWWNVPPSVQWDLEEEGWSIQQIRDTIIGDHMPLRFCLIAGQPTLVNTYIAPLLMQEDDDIVDEFQMDDPEEPYPFSMGAAVLRARQADLLPNYTLPPSYHPETHAETGTPFAAPSTQYNYN